MNLYQYTKDQYYALKTQITKSPYNLVDPGKVSKRDQAIIHRLVQQFTDRTRKDIKKWRSAITFAENPETPRRYLLQDIYTEIMIDNHLFSQVQLRKLSTISKEFKLVNLSSGEEDPEKTKLFEKPWFYKFMSLALDTEYFGTTLIEVGGIIEDGIGDVHIIPRKHVVPEFHEILLDIADEKGIDYKTPEFEPWIMEIEEEHALGILVKVVPQVIWKKNAQTSWVEFIQRFGLPYRSATTNKTDKKSLDRIELMLDQMGSAAYGLFPKGTEIDFKESNSRDAHMVFDKMIERANSEMSKAINSVTMLSDDGSSRSQSEVHQSVNDRLIMSDTRKLGFIINHILFPVLANHGYALEGFEFKWDLTEKLDKKSLWEIVNGVAQLFNVPEEYITKTFGIPTEGVKVQPSTGAPPTPSANFNTGHVPSASHDLAFAWPNYNAHEGCSHNHVLDVLNKTSTSKYESLFDKMAKDLFDGKGSAIPSKVHLERMNKLNQGFNKGFKTRLKVDYDSPDNYRIAMHQANLGRFSAAASFKDVVNINELARNAKNFSAFKKEVASYQKVNLTYLQTEFDHTISASQNAANWLRSVEDQDDIDLRYETAGDSRVRQEHQQLDGIVKPVDDGIWGTIYPPNGWKCRCEVVSIPKGSRSLSKEKTDISAVSKGFRFNPGMTNHIFEQTHSYFNEFPEETTLSRKKYGLDDWTKLNLAKKAGSGVASSSQAAYEKWWAAEIKRQKLDEDNLFYKNYVGLHFEMNKKRLIKKFAGAKYAKENRWGIATAVESILSAPDEVWIQKGQKGVKYAANYLKTYKDGIYVVVVNSEAETKLEVVTWFKVEQNANALGDVRSGILMKKSY